MEYQPRNHNTCMDYCSAFTQTFCNCCYSKHYSQLNQPYPEFPQPAWGPTVIGQPFPVIVHPAPAYYAPLSSMGY